MLKFGQIEVASKDFYGQRQITDIFTIDVNQVVLSDKVPCNNGKDWRYIVGYQVDGETFIPLLIKRLKNIQCHLIFLRKHNGCFSIEKFEMRLSHSYLRN